MGENEPGYNENEAPPGAAIAERTSAVTIDPHRMIQAINVRANDLADETGTRNDPSHMDAVHLV